MTDVIRLLPDSVANQIAAGEVIQRPASVVKELVENAVDAGATRIQVYVADAGRTSIQVVDNGSGMSDMDARLAFERHATSKIQCADDLFRLRTMGFRGEALASIAAVAQVTLTTKLHDDTLGTKIRIEGCRVLYQDSEACAEGSNFLIENLFFNVPARRKFLKSNTTELNNIIAAFERIVLVYPDIEFQLYSDGNEVLATRRGTSRQRIVELFGRKMDADLLPVDVDTAICKITGFVGRPESAKKKGAHTYFFVNGRYMKHPYFHRAVNNAFDRLVPQGMQVPYFIYFDIAPADIDVNIHPTKTEIKFENEQAVFQMLHAAVSDAVGRFCELPTIDFDTEGKPDIPVYDPNAPVVAPTVEYNPQYNPFASGAGGAGSLSGSAAGGFGGSASVGFSGSASVGFSDSAASLSVASGGILGSAAGGDQSLFASQSSPDSSSIADGPVPSSGGNIYFQYKGQYIMTSVKSGLMVIDQQRADQRIRYEQCLAQLREARTPAMQRLMFPEMVQFPPSDASTAQKIMPDILGLGFALTDMGQGSYAVSAVPADMADTDYISILIGLVADAVAHSGDSIDEARRHIAQDISRRAALAPGQVLSQAEMDTIVARLFACENVNYTPDGKAIFRIIGDKEITV